MRGCACPKDGTYLCPSCQVLLERAGHARLPLRHEPERDFQGRLRRAALDLGWQYYHTHDSRKSDEGWPDTILCKPGVLYAWELKVGTHKPTMAQLEWISLLNTVTHLEAAVMRPGDWDLMLDKLRQRGGRG